MDVSGLCMMTLILINIAPGNGLAVVSCAADVSVLYTNLALHKPTHQSTTYDGYYDNGLRGFARRANDGGKSSSYRDGSCSHVGLVIARHWWQVDLQDVFSIVSVSVVNRDSQAERLFDFGIEVSMTDQGDIYGRLMNANPCHYHAGGGIGPSEKWTSQCTPGAVGRHLRIYTDMRTSKWDALTLCEVEVKGYDYVCIITQQIQSSSSEPSTEILLTSSYSTQVMTTSGHTEAISPSYDTTTSYFNTQLLSTSEYTTMISSILSTTSLTTEMTSTLTTSPMNSTSLPTTPANCNCKCTTNTTRYFNVTEAELLQFVETLKRELTVDKKKTSSFKRKLISAPDDRPSAKNIGALGIVMLVLVLGGIVAMDIPRLIQFFR